MFFTHNRTLQVLQAKGRPFYFVCLLVAALIGSCFLIGCDGASESTSGPAFARHPMALSDSPLYGNGGAAIDASTASEGYVSAVASASSRLKFLIAKDGERYSYDMQSGQPIVCPLSMGDGTYTLSIMQQTHGENYITVHEEAHTLYLASEFEPFIRPNVFSNYGPNSACVAKANELSADAENQGDVVKNIYTWVVDNIAYDKEKALSVASGYTPNPDETLISGKGICLDYASLTAAMLRSQGIPCKIVTGYVSSGTIYHAWNMVHIDGSWKDLALTVKPDTWTRIDTTFAASGSSEFVGDGSDYVDVYIY